jgi:uncharacterized MAPEG superfamily protein
MKTAIICVFIASIQPVLFIAVAKVLAGFKLGNNHDPRGKLAKSEGKAYRAKCAHDNSWEAFAPFAAAVILAMVSGVNPHFINKVALIFVGLRFAYGVAYIFDFATSRSIIWTAAVACKVILFYQAWSV